MSPVGHFSKRWFSVCFAAVLVHSVALAGEARAGNEPQATYTVQSGDSLSVIAEQQGVSLALLRKVNRVPSADQIRPGQVLLLPRLHEVKAGEVLGTIAERYQVKLSTLYQHNDLNEKSVLRVGQRVIIVGGSTNQPSQSNAVTRKASRNPPRTRQAAKPKPRSPKVEYYRHKVRKNEVLSAIARRYAVSAKQLCQINQLGNASLIRVGQRLKIPVNEQNLHLTKPKPWHKYARKKFRRGTVTLQTLWGKWSGRVLDKKGHVLPQARKHIQSMLASWETGKKQQIALAPRLYQLIVAVSDEFGGRPIRVVSGYRQRSYARHSKHRVGRALDFSIPGVPNSAIVDFLLTLRHTGVGYYPNSTHVHMDARSSRMYWVDVSGPGQAPQYVHKSRSGERAPTATYKTAKGRRSRYKTYRTAKKHRSQSNHSEGVSVAQLTSQR